MTGKLPRASMMILFTALIAACTRAVDPTSAVPTESVASGAEGSRIPADLNARISTNANAILQGINVLRAEAGAPALISHPDLSELASGRAADMALGSYLAHEDPDSGQIAAETALAEMGYSGPAAELLFADRGSLDNVPESVTRAWNSDPMHRALLLEPSFRYCGIGLMGDGDAWKISMILTVGLPEEDVP